MDAEGVKRYITEHSEPEPPLLQELSRETARKGLGLRMLSGHYQGRLLALLSKLIRPTCILEIGTYTGYSALCLVEGLAPGGRLITIDQNEKWQSLAGKYFEQSPYKDQIKPLIGHALEVIPDLNEQFDLVFIDADKRNYINYFDLVIDQMNSGAVLLSDNVLWYGKVLQTAKRDDLNTQTLQKFNAILAADQRLETVMLPIRDGLSISRVK